MTHGLAFVLMLVATASPALLAVEKHRATYAGGTIARFTGAAGTRLAPVERSN